MATATLSTCDKRSARHRDCISWPICAVPISEPVRSRDTRCRHIDMRSLGPLLEPQPVPSTSQASLQRPLFTAAQLRQRTVARRSGNGKLTTDQEQVRLAKAVEHDYQHAWFKPFITISGSSYYLCRSGNKGGLASSTEPTGPPHRSQRGQKRYPGLCAGEELAGARLAEPRV